MPFHLSAEAAAAKLATVGMTRSNKSHAFAVAAVRAAHPSRRDQVVARFRQPAATGGTLAAIPPAESIFGVAGASRELLDAAAHIAGNISARPTWAEAHAILSAVITQNFEAGITPQTLTQAQVIITAALEMMAVSEIECLAHAAWLRLSAHPEWAEAADTWLQPHRLSGAFAAWADGEPGYRCLAARIEGASA